MPKQMLNVVAGFVLLFALYHAAEYMILFQNSPAGFLLFQVLFFITAWLVAKAQAKPGLAAWGLNLKKGFLSHLFFGMLMGILLYGSTYLISLVLGTEKITKVPSLSASLTPLSLFIFGSFFSSFSEDILTRGYIYTHLQGKIGKWLIVIISATVYLLNHIYRLGDGIVTYVYLFLLGILFILPLILTRRLWFTGGMHWAGNVTFFITHEIIRTEEGTQLISPNYILAAVILLMIPLNYFIQKRWKLVPVGVIK